MDLNSFIDQVTQRAVPRSAIGRIRMLARELAEGSAEGLWGVRFDAREFDLEGEQPEGETVEGTPRKRLLPSDETLRHYLRKKWDNYRAFPEFYLLERNGYLTLEHEDRFWLTYALTQAAFALIEEVEPSTIFISYRRGDSSAFALLLLTRLKHAGFEPFLDLALVPGEDWNAGLKGRIEARDYFVVLLGKETLASPFVVDEITWAVEAGKTIIPIWHNGFEYRAGEWADVPVKVDRALTYAHTIRVVEENPLAYNNAILELLNHFGYTPLT